MNDMNGYCSENNDDDDDSDDDSDDDNVVCLLDDYWLQSNTFFFLHKIHDQKKLDSLGYNLDVQIMNSLINENIIVTPYKHVVIYSIDVKANLIKVTPTSPISGKLQKYNKPVL